MCRPVTNVTRSHLNVKRAKRPNQSVSFQVFHEQNMSADDGVCTIILLLRNRSIIGSTLTTHMFMKYE